MTGPEDTDRRSAEARRWAARHAGELTGRPLADAEAAVRAAGLRIKVLRPGGWTTLEYGIGRITVRVDDQDRVTELHAG
ncbi:MAG: I78 family peptidase inhibitor [Amnibacterium sp.]